MDYKSCLAAGIVAAALAGVCSADMIATGDGVAVKPSSIETPARGMTMDQVAAKFGAPASKVPGVGQPSIARWEYPGFTVYFEGNHVIHCVVAG